MAALRLGLGPEAQDPSLAHGKQQLSSFHGYYEKHIESAMLRLGNTHAFHGSLAVLKTLIEKLKKAK
jgi:hypothetical protein